MNKYKTNNIPKLSRGSDKLIITSLKILELLNDNRECCEKIK